MDVCNQNSLSIATFQLSPTMATFQINAATALELIQQAATRSHIDIQDQEALTAALPEILASCAAPCPTPSSKATKSLKKPADASQADLYERSSFVAIDKADCICCARVWQSGRGGRCSKARAEGSDFCKQHGKELKTPQRDTKRSKWKGQEVINTMTWEHMGRIDEPRCPLIPFLYLTEEELSEAERFKSARQPRKQPRKKKPVMNPALESDGEGEEEVSNKAKASKKSDGKKKKKTDEGEKKKKKTDEGEKKKKKTDEGESNTTTDQIPQDDIFQEEEDEDVFGDNDSEEEEEEEDSEYELINESVDGQLLVVNTEAKRLVYAKDLSEFKSGARKEPVELNYDCDDSGETIHIATIETDGSITWTQDS